jgi:arsenate reductase
MNTSLLSFIDHLDIATISSERKAVLRPLTAYIQDRVNSKSPVNLNLICTHNSRRSHLSQVWAQTMASYFELENVFCYSGGTEATALFPKVIDTLKTHGFDIHTISTGTNPVYSIKYDRNRPAIIGFSKTFDHPFNVQSNFAAVMTCSHADENCPFIPGADQRIALNYEDPKHFDNTPKQTEKYMERSVQIATEMRYVFAQIKR